MSRQVSLRDGIAKLCRRDGQSSLMKRNFAEKNEQKLLTKASMITEFFQILIIGIQYIKKISPLLIPGNINNNKNDDIVMLIKIKRTQKYFAYEIQQMWDQDKVNIIATTI